MKIGIVTWHKGNIGSTLQAFALCETIKKLGYDPVLINYVTNSAAPYVRGIRNILFHACFLKSGLTRDKTYRFISQRTNETQDMLYRELVDCSKNYDAFVCGSDQIWNCVGGVDPVYFLQFAPEKKRISYAPSIGLKNIQEAYQKRFCEYVKSIPYLSIREESGARIIYNLTGLVPKVVLDPTLLLRKTEWLSLSKRVTVDKLRLRKNSYILCYYLGDHIKYNDYTERLAKETGKRIVYVSFKRKNFGKNQIVCSIEEFIALIRDSYCVLTDSFHGTVVPLNLGKKVAVFERFSENDSLNQNNRIYNILNKFGIQNWIISPDDDVNSFIGRVDDEEAIQQKLEKERTESISYLNNCLLNVCQIKEDDG